MENFYEKVYKLVAQIPRGKVATYGQIAAMLKNPRASRAVGYALRNTPPYLDIPCHRVISKSGELAKDCVFGGVERQREMLVKEGVVFKEDGLVDMEKSLWIVGEF